MLILGIDTSCACAKVALTEDTHLLAESYNDDQRTHSVKLMPMVDNLFRTSGRDIGEVELIGVINGPGSFTGLRIGAATAKAIAFALDIPVVGVNTLEFLAVSVTEQDKIICPAVDARNANVYSAIYFQGKILKECRVRSASELAAESLSFAEHFSSEVRMTGDGAAAYRAVYASVLGERYGESDSLSGKAEVICRLAAKIYADTPDKSVFSHENLTVNYYRPSQAERMRAEKEAAPHD